MLVVVHDRNIEGALQTLLYVETLGGFDVLKVDAAECRGNLLHGLAELLGVFLSHLYIENVNASVNLEEQAFALHHGLAAHRADVAKS